MMRQLASAGSTYIREFQPIGKLTKKLQAMDSSFWSSPRWKAGYFYIADQTTYLSVRVLPFNPGSKIKLAAAFQVWPNAFPAFGGKKCEESRARRKGHYSQCLTPVARYPGGESAQPISTVVVLEKYSRLGCLIVAGVDHPYTYLSGSWIAPEESEYVGQLEVQGSKLFFQRNWWFRFWRLYNLSFNWKHLLWFWWFWHLPNLKGLDEWKYLPFCESHDTPSN
ncbi:hypothetical protein MYX64_08445 [Nitrospinae bacterium AH_259_B05_G02_I21]|nr:hypothetical protein [Nitrospinae bacterium AH_259_B05_G02_I21]MDA2932416.1 hypothetical protein [Nitrospinae bacterium AH-259-F20]